RELAAGVGRLERQARHRIHLEHRADDEEERRLAGERERAVDRLRGEELAEEDDVGLQDPAAVQAGRRAAAGPLEELEHVLERIPSAAPGAGRRTAAARAGGRRGGRRSPGDRRVPAVEGFPFATEVGVRFAETDAQGIAHNSIYLVWFELARVEYLARFAGGYQALRDLGIE